MNSPLPRERPQPLTLKVEATGATDDDLLIALDEVKRLISEGFSSGFGSNESGSFSFEYSDTAWRQTNES